MIFFCVIPFCGSSIYVRRARCVWLFLRWNTAAVCLSSISVTKSVAASSEKLRSSSGVRQRSVRLSKRTIGPSCAVPSHPLLPIRPDVRCSCEKYLVSTRRSSTMPRWQHFVRFCAFKQLRYQAKNKRNKHLAFEHKTLKESSSTLRTPFVQTKNHR